MADKQIIKKFSDNHCLVLENNQISLRENELTAYRIVLGKSTNELLEFVKDTYLQLKRKEQECEELKEKVKELRQCWIDCDKERNLQEANSEFRQRVINRYKQTLAEIKEIAEVDFNHTCWKTYAKQLKQILQKISEVLND